MTPRIALAGPERLDELGPLWLQLHQHHARVSRVNERRGLVPGRRQLYRVTAAAR